MSNLHGEKLFKAFAGAFSISCSMVIMTDVFLLPQLILFTYEVITYYWPSLNTRAVLKFEFLSHILH